MNTLAVKQFKAGPEEEAKAQSRGYVEINLPALRHNVRLLQGAMTPGCELMAILKADAYGHRMNVIAPALARMGVRAFAVATADEGIALRELGIGGMVLILGYTAPERASELQKYDLTQTILDSEYGAALDRQGYDLRVHLKTDTGMHRLGIDSEDQQKILDVFHLPHLTVTGIYTHLCVSDSLEPEKMRYTEKQIRKFYNLVDSLKKQGITGLKTHIQSSSGLLNYPLLPAEYVRAGIALYGVKSQPEDRRRLNLPFCPVLSLKSKIVLLRGLSSGEQAGYGLDFTARRETIAGILPVGYADGIPRSLSDGKGTILIGGCRVPVLGRICMDQMAVDVTDVPHVHLGQEAVFIGKDGNLEITAAEMAESAGTIANELLSRLGTRLGLYCIE